MLRPLGLACLSVSLAACASLLGDFDVVADPGDGGTGPGPGDGSTTSETGPGVDAGAQPEPIEVAVNQSATCATVKYGATLKSYCWGAANVLNAKSYLGATEADQPTAGFYVPHVAAGAALTFERIFGTGSGNWFIGNGTTSQGANTAFTWGSNLFTQSGQKNVPASDGVLPGELFIAGTTTRIEAKIAAGGQQHGCVIDGGNLYCWGTNLSCQATSADALPGTCIGQPKVQPEPAAPIAPGKASYERVATGAGHTCVIAKPSAAERTVFCFGDNKSGQCGLKETTTTVGAAKTPTGLPALIGNDAVIAAGDQHTCAILRNDLWCWGLNDRKQSDPSSNDNFRAPAKLDLRTVAGDISNLTLAGNASCFVVKPIAGRSRAFCFGSGELGRENASSPIAPVAGIEDVSRLALSNKHGCAIAKATGSSEVGLWCWGANDAKAVDPSSSEPRFPTPHRVLFPAL